MAAAYAAIVRATVGIITQLNAQIARLEAEFTRTFEQHTDAAIAGELPGLGPVLGARVLGRWISSGAA